MAATIQQLTDLISSSVTELLAISAENNLQLPELDKPLNSASDAFYENDLAAHYSSVIIAAATQIALTLARPHQSVCQLGLSHLTPAAMRVWLETNVAEIIREAGPSGAPIHRIASRAGIDESKLGRLLRFLSNNHIFREVRPNVFANNLLSSTMDTGKSVDVLLESPKRKHDGTLGFVALTELTVTEYQKASSYLYETITDPTATAIQRAYNTNLSFFDWLGSDEYRHRRFGIAMTSAAAMDVGNKAMEEFDWAGLPSGAVVVDVGGGIGVDCMTIAKIAPHVKMVIQDFSATVEHGKEVWKKDLPQAIEENRLFKVTLSLSHDFFTPQPVKNASVFLFKHVLHAWPESLGVKLLSHLRDVATPETKLLIATMIASYICDDPELDDALGPQPKAPKPLLPTYGRVNNMPYLTDVVMILGFGGHEPTTGDIRRMLSLSRWKLEKVYWNDCVKDTVCLIQAVPV